MNRLVSKLIQKLKNDPEYHIDSKLTFWVIWGVVWERFWQMLRGIYFKLRFSKSKGLLFIGKSVIIRNPQLIQAGKNLTLKDYVFVQALSQEGIQFGDNVMVGRYTTIECTGVIRELGVGLKVGNNSNFGDYNFIGVRGAVTIGNDVLFGPRVSIHSENHNSGQTDVPIRRQGETRAGVIIEDDCWIGSGAIIVDGVIIHRGSIVAAGAVVTKDVPPFSVVAGVPARIVRQRCTTELDYSLVKGDFPE